MEIHNLPLGTAPRGQGLGANRKSSAMSSKEPWRFQTSRKFNPSEVAPESGRIDPMLEKNGIIWP